MSSRRDPTLRWIYSTPTWRRVRLEILARDGGQCQIRGEGCTGTATEVDHKVPLRNGGNAFDPDNLRAACKPCNIARAHRGRGRRRYLPSREW